MSFPPNCVPSTFIYQRAKGKPFYGTSTCRRRMEAAARCQGGCHGGCCLLAVFCDVARRNILCKTKEVWLLCPLLSSPQLPFTLECCRLSVLTCILFCLESPYGGVSFASCVLEFVTSGHDTAERERRLRHTYNYINKASGYGKLWPSESSYPLVHAVSIVLDKYWRYSSLGKHFHDKLFLSSTLPLTLLSLLGSIFSSIVTLAHFGQSLFVHGIDLSSCPFWFGAVATLMIIPPLYHWRRLYWCLRTTLLLHACENHVAPHRYYRRHEMNNFSALLLSYRLRTTVEILRNVVPEELVPTDPLHVVAALVGEQRGLDTIVATWD